MNLLKVSTSVKRYQVSFKTMFRLIWVEIWAVEGQKIFRADSITPPLYRSTGKPTLIRVKSYAEAWMNTPTP